ncbi:hypothetical protein DFH06DRAFT_170229 [Mycena polygramma]|nr:hypothetical protein DFH06DRAFT_170229 [Mycena polygramma]
MEGGDRACRCGLRMDGRSRVSSSQASLASRITSPRQSDSKPASPRALPLLYCPLRGNAGMLDEGDNIFERTGWARKARGNLFLVITVHVLVRFPPLECDYADRCITTVLCTCLVCVAAFFLSVSAVSKRWCLAGRSAGGCAPLTPNSHVAVLELLPCSSRHIKPCLETNLATVDCVLDRRPGLLSLYCKLDARLPVKCRRLGRLLTSSKPQMDSENGSRYPFLWQQSSRLCCSFAIRMLATSLISVSPRGYGSLLNSLRSPGEQTT